MFILINVLAPSDQPPPHPRLGRPSAGHWWWLIVVWLPRRWWRKPYIAMVVVDRCGLWFAGGG